MLDTKITTLLRLTDIGSYTKTAQALSLTQPAISNHIKMLEQEFDIKIFYQDKRKLRLTPEGEILVKYARRATALSDSVRNELEDYKKSVKSYKIGITPTAEENLATYIFATYCNEHPNTRIKIITNNIKNIYDMLTTYELDLGIVDGDNYMKNFHSVLLDTDYLCLAVSPKHRLAKRKNVTLSELRYENFILRLPGTGTRTLFENHLVTRLDNISNYTVIMELDNISAIKEMVELNLGVTIISHNACRKESAKGKLNTIPIENLSMVRQLNIVYGNDFEHTEILDEIQRIYEEKR